MTRYMSVAATRTAPSTSPIAPMASQFISILLLGLGYNPNSNRNSDEWPRHGSETLHLGERQKRYLAPQQKADPLIRLFFMPERPLSTTRDCDKHRSPEQSCLRHSPDMHSQTTVTCQASEYRSASRSSHLLSQTPRNRLSCSP